MNRFAPLFLAAPLVLGGCVSTLAGDHYDRREARVAADVEYGFVEELRPVVIEGTKTAIGPAVGGAVGGVAASDVGDGRGRRIARVLGTVAGGVAGAAVEEGITRRQGVEITVRMADGEHIAVVQEVDADAEFRPGDEVRVVFLAGSTRVTPRY